MLSKDFTEPESTKIHTSGQEIGYNGLPNTADQIEGNNQEAGYFASLPTGETDLYFVPSTSV